MDYYLIDLIYACVTQFVEQVNYSPGYTIEYTILDENSAKKK